MTLNDTDGQVLIDTGNPGSNLPDVVWNAIYNPFNPTVTNDGNYLIDCNKVPQLPPITMNFRGSSNNLIPIILKGSQQVIVGVGCECMLIFTPMGSPEIEISFGSTFLSNYFSVFDFTGGGSLVLYGTDAPNSLSCTPGQQITGKKRKSRYNLSTTRKKKNRLVSMGKFK
jgi:hypothetical protein